MASTPRGKRGPWKTWDLLAMGRAPGTDSQKTAILLGPSGNRIERTGSNRRPRDRPGCSTLTVPTASTFISPAGDSLRGFSFSETEYDYIAQAGLELVVILLLQLPPRPAPQVLGLQACPTMPNSRSMSVPFFHPPPQAVLFSPSRPQTH